MRAKLVFEKFMEDLDPIKDMNIGAIKQLNLIKDTLESSGYIDWEEVYIPEGSLKLELDRYAESYIPYEFNNVMQKYYEWSDVYVTKSFILLYYVDIDLEQNTLKRLTTITNEDIEDFQYDNQKTLSKKVRNLDPEKILEIVEDDFINNQEAIMRKAAKEAWEIAETDAEKTNKRIS